MIIVETPRLILRELEEKDLAAITPFMGHPVVMQFWPQPYTSEKCIEWIASMRQRYTKDGCAYWLMQLKATGEYIGQAGILIANIEGMSLPNLGYILAHEHWGKGYATEAALACRDLGFERGYGIMYTLIRPENSKSISVAMRLGMKAERTLKYSGLDHTLYSIARG
jgi:[ribosomal protein S5]-alanine N-acetyltransferase